MESKTEKKLKTGCTDLGNGSRQASYEQKVIRRDAGSRPLIGSKLRAFEPGELLSKRKRGGPKKKRKSTRDRMETKEEECLRAK